MRKYMLIAALVLGSATAQAAGSRGLILASNDDPATAEAPKATAVEAPAAAPAETPKALETPAATPKYVARPAAVEPAPAPAAVTPKADAAKPAADKPRHRHESTEARVIYELHRHGIYW
jgi:hypothetical protein